MPYREKTAWLSVVTMLITFGPYFVFAALQSPEGDAVPNVGQLAIFALTAVVQVIILGAGHLVLRRGSPDDARTPPDERDREIIRRSISYAYYVLIVGMILVGCVMPFNSDGWAIINAALFMIIAAEIVHYGAIVAGYRAQS